MVVCGLGSCKSLSAPLGRLRLTAVAASEKCTRCATYNKACEATIPAFAGLARKIRDADRFAADAASDVSSAFLLLPDISGVWLLLIYYQDDLMKSLGDGRRALQAMKTKSGSALKRAKDRDATIKQPNPADN